PRRIEQVRLSLVRRQHTYRCCETYVRVRIHWFVNARLDRREHTDGATRHPLARGTHWARFETAAAVRAHVHKYRLDTRAAERALEAADHRVRRVGRK